MRGKRILFCDADPQARQTAEQALAGTGSSVELASDLREVDPEAACDEYDLLMISCAPKHLEDADWLDRLDRLDACSPKANVVLHTTGKTEAYLPLMNQRRFVRNLIAKNEQCLDADELIITAEKILRRDIFGLQKYLLGDVEPLRLEIRCSNEKADYLQTVADYAATLGCKTRSIEMIESLADELITNAIFNAPRNPDGSAKYAKRSRRLPVALEEHEVGQLHVACDGAFIAIAQIDPFGALTPETIISYLNRGLVKGPDQISTATGGAGIGLLRVFHSLSKFVINIDPGRKTEVITLVDLRLSMKRFRLAPKSFHIFIAETSGNKIRANREDVGRGASA
jgi:hypothetical protein